MYELSALSIALSMDAFAVSVSLGTKTKHKTLIALKAAVLFGFFQGLMPCIGFMGERFLARYFNGYDLFIAAFLLFAIGIKMIYEALYDTNKNETTQTTNATLLFLAIATSIDALGAGFGLGFIAMPIVLSIFTIAFTTFVISFTGVFIGYKFSQKFEQKAEILGGVILILLGVKFLYS